MRALFLSHSDVANVVRRVGVDELMDQLIDNLTDALVEFEPSRIEVPVRAGFSYELPTTGLLEWMPAIQFGDVTLIKIVGYHPANVDQHGLPTILSMMSLFDTQTGRLLAMVDGTLMTAMRTGAASAIATRLLAAPNSSTLGVVGCGAQAVTQIHAVSRVLEIDQILTYDTALSASASIRSRVQGFLSPQVDIRACSREEVVAGADVLCVATSVAPRAGPVLEAGSPTKAWIHINAVGSDFPGKVELPVSLLTRSLVCPDSLEQARIEGECQQLEAGQVGPSLPQLARDPAKYADAKARSTVFDSTGWALEDLVAARLALRFAREFGMGSEFEVVPAAEDPRHPYEFLAGGSKAASGGRSA